MRAFTTAYAALIGLASTTVAEQVVLEASQGARPKPINVAIIGAGAAGASTAYHLARYAHNASLPIAVTIFERNPYIGGRSTTVGAYNDTSLPIELGASIFVEVNKILVDAVNKFNLSASSIRRVNNIPGANLAVWDGEKIILTQYGGWWDYAKLFWKYGRAPIQTMNLMKKTVSKFLSMYEAPIFPFSSLTQAAQDVGLLAVTAATGEQYMRENGIGGSFGRDVVQASTRVNYAQNLGFIHGLEAMVCMAAEGAMAVEGGNWRIFEAMIQYSGADLKLDTEVGGIWSKDEGGYTLNYSHPDGTDSGSGLFDAVVLASPYQYSDLKSLGLDSESNDHHPDKIPYVELHVTLFSSPHLLSPAFFSLPPNKPAPQIIITTLPEGEPAQQGPKGVGSPGFFSISLLQPITNPKTNAPEYLYKIFSPNPTNSTFLAHILGVQDLADESDNHISERDVTWIYRKVWNSYPYELPRVTFEEIKLGADLWYTSGMDSFISTMETNALMGKNVAALMVENWIAKGAESVGGDVHGMNLKHGL